MPELPEVETIKRQLSAKLKNKKIATVEIKIPKLIQGISIFKFKQLIVGAKIKQVRRRAKLLIVDLNNRYSLLTHLKMSGQLIFLSKFSADKINSSTVIIYFFTDGSVLLFNNPRRFAYVKLVATDQLTNIFSEFGPEPLESAFNLAQFKELLARRPRSKIKPLLMDQHWLAGIGNLYAQEICFYAEVSPFRLVNSLSEQEMKKIYQGIKKILPMAIKYRGSSTDQHYVDTDNRPGDYNAKIMVYSRQGKKCFRCGSIIKKIKLSGRGTCYCPYCQK
ncbi:MAG: bifunctional DNA-formamidopyrimidine glycosylase/DNA-(apurinic or apyrimidinic site) lyase [Candidatus Aenigmarchaeota archaeon]|nr:bifunctional DNA-formamidopyrimidine glycosylase/DNA-(apurinic or apyrimidinic site) lyase [Candidatus Aenigmarchaeota archaeon]